MPRTGLPPVDDGTARFTRNKTVEWIDRIITDVENEALQAGIRAEVKEFMAAYLLYAGVGLGQINLGLIVTNFAYDIFD